jgi:hypothetical protein
MRWSGFRLRCLDYSSAIKEIEQKKRNQIIWDWKKRRA